MSRTIPAPAMTLAAPFVGRSRELRRLRVLLESGRSIVVTGSYGSGRTSLVRQLETQLGERYQFVFVRHADTRRSVRLAVARAAGSARERSPHADLPAPPARVVVVFDDVVRLTAQRSRFIRELLDDDRMCVILIAERAVASGELVRVRGILKAAAVVHVGPLGRRDVEQYIVARANAAGLSWPMAGVREMARATNGYALGMRLTVDAALRRSAAPTSVSFNGALGEAASRARVHGQTGSRTALREQPGVSTKRRVRRHFGGAGHEAR